MREPSPLDRRTLNELILVITTLLLTLAFSLFSGKDAYIFGYIMTIVYVVSQVTRHNRPLQELGVKRGFTKDFKRIWYYFGIDAVLFQLLPPTLGIALVFGYYPDLVNHITGRLSISLGSLEGIYAIAGLLAAALVLTLMEEVVFRVTIQERLSWFIGSPARARFWKPNRPIIEGMREVIREPFLFSNVEYLYNRLNEYRQAHSLSPASLRTNPSDV